MSETTLLDGVGLTLPPDILDRLADMVAERLAIEPERPAAPSPYLDVAEAAEYLRASRQRVYDLVSARAIPKYKDGARVLLRRDDLDAYLTSR